MPKVTSHTPSWLARPSPGFDLFNKSPAAQTNGHVADDSNSGAPLRTLAVRGTEIFFASGNEIRWAELSKLQEQADSRRDNAGTVRRSRSRGNDQTERPYRTLKVPSSRKIQQLIISPNGLYIAIVSSHTVHIAVLPDPSHLSSQDTTPLKLKTHHVGPTTHVLERSPIASVLWHPLGANGDCLVTITTEAVVRIWELDRDNRWSFDQAAFAVDLKKLANGSSTEGDFSPSKYGTSKGFSPDSFEMEVVSACFGAPNTVDESLWPPMTLWVAMREGDVYALCPLLPSRFQQHIFTLQKLLDAERVEISAIKEGLEGVPQYAKEHVKQHLSWISDIEAQVDAEYAYDASLPTQILKRPSAPSPVPRLQGPFQLAPDPDMIFDITDICVLTPEPRSDMDSEEDAEGEEIASSLETVCLATSDGIVHVCMSLNKIEPRWLPPKRRGSKITPSDAADKDTIRDLLILESISLTSLSTQKPTKTESSWPLFTPDTTATSKTFITSASGVVHLDISPFQKKLTEELSGEGDSGIDFRIGLLVDNNATSCTRVITPDTRNSASTSESAPVAAINVLDPVLGHFILTISGNTPTAVTLSSDSLDLDDLSSTSSLPHDHDNDAETDLALTLYTTHLHTGRKAYAAPDIFYQSSALDTYEEDHVPKRARRSMHEELRFSPATLDAFMDLHRILSSETHDLGVAAAELVRRSERLDVEKREKEGQFNDVRARIERVVGEADGEGKESTREQVETRIQKVRMTQETLVRRYEGLRVKVAGLNRRPFGDKEKEWAAEVGRLGGLTLGEGDRDVLGDVDLEKTNGEHQEEGEEDAEAQEQTNGAEAQNPTHEAETYTRYTSARALCGELISQTSASDHADSTAPSLRDGSTAAPFSPFSASIGLERRKARSAEVEGLLERQSALMDMMKGRVERLGREVV